MKQTIQWYFDIQTKKDQLQIIDVRAGGEGIRSRLLGFFGLYRFFKLGRINVKLVPASTLPVDPTGLSLEAGEQTVDPRDQLNPGCVRITNGEALDLSVVSKPIDYQRAVYQNLVNDYRWSKFMLQKGCSRSAIPLYWTLGSLESNVYPGSMVNLPTMADVGGTMYVADTSSFRISSNANGTTSLVNDVGYSDPRGIFQTGRSRLGWLPTSNISPSGTLSGPSGQQGMLWPVPSVSTITIVLPPAYKTVYYYRVFITEDVYFKDLMQVFPGPGYTSLPGLDNFQILGLQSGIVGQTTQSQVSPGITVSNNGGGSDAD